MTTTTENQTTKAKQVPDFYIFENLPNGQQGNGKPAGVGFAHKKGKGYTLLVGGKRYAVFPRKAEAAQPAAATEGGGA